MIRTARKPHNHIFQVQKPYGSEVQGHVRNGCLACTEIVPSHMGTGYFYQSQYYRGVSPYAY